MERTYNIPLRREWLKAPKYRRAKRAIAAVRTFLLKHMKGSEVKIGQHLNMSIWERGIKSPPHHVEVKATKDDKGIVTAELVSAPVEEKAEVEKVPKAKPSAEKGAEAPTAKTTEPKPAQKKADHTEKKESKPKEDKPTKKEK